MSNPEIDRDVLAETTFSTIVKKIGAPIIMQVFEQARETLEAGGEGVTFADDAATASVAIGSDEMVSFRWGTWGPYTLPIEQARSILATPHEST